MRRLTSVLCMALLALPWGDPALAQSKGQPENLLAAMKLWGDIKFFDPQIAGGKVDWDAALMHAEPAILSSKTPEAYRAAIASMLAPLGDPATHVDAPPSSGTRGISANKMGNGVLITVPHGLSDDNSEIAAGAKFIAFRVAAEIVVVVENQNAHIWPRLLAVKISSGQSADASAYDGQIIFLTSALGFAGGVPELSVAQAMCKSVCALVIAAHPHQGWRIVGRILLGRKG